jgi:hypothetical protein
MSVTCPKCNQVVKSTDGFCESCGFKIGNISNGHSSVASSDQHQQQKEQEQHSLPYSKLQSSPDNAKKVCKNKLCTNYNVEYGIDENYCGMCGSELVLITATSQEPDYPDLLKKKGFIVMPDGSELEITPTQRLIGRTDLAKYISEEELNHISRGHFTAFMEGEKYYIQDEETTVQKKQSKNKTWLVSGGQKEEITGKGRRELKDGDEINLADTCTLTFKLKE